jgi:hypothetical protein
MLIELCLYYYYLHNTIYTILFTQYYLHYIIYTILFTLYYSGCDGIHSKLLLSNIL